MRKLIILLILLAEMCNAAEIKTQKRAIAQALTKLVSSTLTKANSKTFASAVAKQYFTRVTSGCTIGITNSMSTRDLINPRLYLVKGYTVSPPPLRIRAFTNQNERFTKVAFIESARKLSLQNKPKGVLCYNCPSDIGTKKMICIHFDVNSQTFGFTVQLMTDFYDENSFNKLYLKNIQLMSSAAAPFGMFLRAKLDELGVVIIAQMTSSKNARLFLEVQDIVALNSYKREVSAIAMAAAGAAYTIGSAAWSYFTAQEGTILTLENESTEKEHIILEDPIWYMEGVSVEDIIPWDLGPKQSNEITLVAPFAAGTSIFNRLKASVFALSFRVRGTLDRIVLTIWWPRKLTLGGHNSYSLSWLPRGKDAHKEQMFVEGKLKEVVAVIQNKITPKESFVTTDDGSLNVPIIRVDKYQHYFYWEFPLIEKKQTLKVLTGMGSGRKNGMVVKFFGATHVEAPLSLIPDPVPFRETAEEQIPPV